MIVEVLNVGTELLLGEVVNTHAGWLAKQIFLLGFVSRDRRRFLMVQLLGMGFWRLLTVRIFFL